MKIKTSELTRTALNWAVCVAEFGYGSDYKTNQYSTDWGYGGWVIEREGIAIRKYGDFPETAWQADKWQFRFAEPQACGPTPLIAAMRCYVTSKLGEEVEIPEELL